MISSMYGQYLILFSCEHCTVVTGEEGGFGEMKIFVSCVRAGLDGK